MDKLKLAVFISGRGSNLKAILQSIDSQQLNVSIEIVISNNPQAQGLSLASKANIPTAVFIPKEYSNNDDYENAIKDHLSKCDIDYIILAGYMKIVGPLLISHYPNKILNIHPSLLPSFKGLNAQQQPLDYGVRYTGCSVHFVTGELDGGPIILQEIVEVLPHDTVESLSDRILEKEHILYSKTIDLISKNKVQIQDNKVLILN